MSQWLGTLRKANCDTIRFWRHRSRAERPSERQGAIQKRNACVSEFVTRRLYLPIDTWHVIVLISCTEHPLFMRWNAYCP